MIDARGWSAGGASGAGGRVPMAERPLPRLVSGVLSLALLVAVGLVLLPVVAVAIVLSAGYAGVLFAGWLVRERLRAWGWMKDAEGREGVKVRGRAGGPDQGV